MRNLLSAALILCGFISLHAQHRKHSEGQASVRIRKDMPGVYVMFGRAGQLKSPEKGDEEQRVWLRLHNNTRWPLRLDMGGVPSAEYGDVELFYDVVSGRGDLIFRGQCHVCTINELGPGKTLMFSVPGEDLAGEHSIRISFSYSWEDRNDVLGGREAKHHVYFSSSQLLQKVQKNVR